jgi:uncharacterized protein YkwD
MLKRRRSRRLAFALAAVMMAFAPAAFLAGGCLSISGPPAETDTVDAPSSSLQDELQANIEKVKANTAVLASAIHDLINEERRGHGLAPLQWDQTLAMIALEHSEDMAARDYFDHVSPEGHDFADRYREHGYNLDTRIGDRVYLGGENLFLGNVVSSYTYDELTGEVHEYRYKDLDELARSTVQGWMDSPGHRENILTPFTREGIGIYVTDEGEVYITQNFS